MSNSDYDLSDVPDFGANKKRVITAYNPDAAKDIELPGGKNLLRGGFGSEVVNNCYPFGVVADVRHDDGSTQEIVATELSYVYILGWDTYWVARNSDARSARRLIPFHRVSDEAKLSGWSSGSKMNYYIVFADDVDMRIHSITTSGLRTNASNERIASVLPAIAARAAKIVGAKSFSVAGLLTTIGISEKVSATSADGKKSDIVMPQTDLPNLVTDDELKQRIAPPELYAKLVELSRQVRDTINDEKARALPFHEILALANGDSGAPSKPVQTQLPAPKPSAGAVTTAINNKPLINMALAVKAKHPKPSDVVLKSLQDARALIDNNPTQAQLDAMTELLAKHL